jgi:hypothetical protein
MDLVDSTKAHGVVKIWAMQKLSLASPRLTELLGPLGLGDLVRLNLQTENVRMSTKMEMASSSVTQPTTLDLTGKLYGRNTGTHKQLSQQKLKKNKLNEYKNRSGSTRNILFHTRKF